jgi:hypothetical protein
VTLSKQEIEVAFDLELQNLRDLNRDVDFIEATTQKFLEGLYADSQSLTSEHATDANKLLQYVIRIRTLQKQLEEKIPEIPEKREDYDVTEEE